MAKKERIDILLVDRELVDTRSKAKAIIMAGEVFVNEQRVDKAGQKVDPDARIEIKGRSLIKYVSRGGLKLEAAIDAFGFDCQNLVVIDVGASTGGFTDCVLQKGATRVYAIDVGYNQLAWRLRTDERVISHERTNMRHTQASLLPELCDLAVIDCSFISLDLILPPTQKFLKEGACLIVLIKPQFEVGRHNIEKGGVVRDVQARLEAIDRVIKSAEKLGFIFSKGIDCPVHGPAGNIEYLALFEFRSSQGITVADTD